MCWAACVCRVRLPSRLSFNARGFHACAELPGGLARHAMQCAVLLVSVSACRRQYLCVYQCTGA